MNNFILITVNIEWFRLIRCMSSMYGWRWCGSIEWILSSWWRLWGWCYRHISSIYKIHTNYVPAANVIFFWRIYLYTLRFRLIDAAIRRPSISYIHSQHKWVLSSIVPFFKIQKKIMQFRSAIEIAFNICTHISCDSVLR